MTPAALMMIKGIARVEEVIEPNSYGRLVIYLYPWWYYSAPSRDRIKEALYAQLPFGILPELHPWWPWHGLPESYTRA